MRKVDDVVFIPLESVFEKDGKTIAYVLKGSTPQPREIQLGLKNSNFVVVTEGLQPGEKVTLRDPQAKEQLSATTKKDQKKKDQSR
jgi:hypothetical protein